MKKEIIINSTVNEVRVAITEDDSLAEFFIETPEKKRIVGNIYLGKVTNIKQGLNAAFVNIGFRSDAFLHFSDVDESLEKTVILDDEEDESQEEQVAELFEQTIIDTDGSSVALRKNLPSSQKDGPIFSTKRSGDIQINIEEGQDLIVQVNREAYSTKGVKVTSKIAIPGRYLVLLPFDKLLGVSRKIPSVKERKKLRYFMREMSTDDYGCVIRTAAKGRSREDLQTDWEYLVQAWKEIEAKVKKSEPPTLLYNDVTLTKSLVRDVFDNRISNLWVDSRKLFNEINSYVKWFAPKLAHKVKYFDLNTSIFDHFDLTEEINNIYRRQIYLRNGGSIVLEQTEAMKVIDVNSGKSSYEDQEKMALNTNLEAAKEIANQLRLRDIGGMIVIDFIDMMQESNRKKLYGQMKNELSKDRAKWVIYPLTQLGLMQITRQRVNQNITEKISQVCPTCKGSGTVPTLSFTINNIENWLKKFKSVSNEFRLLIKVHPKVADDLTSGAISKLSRLMFRYFVRLKVLQDDSIPLTDFKILSVRNQKEITKDIKV